MTTSRSAFDLDLVMNTLDTAQSANELCKSDFSALYLRQGDILVARGLAHTDPTQADFLRRTPLQADTPARHTSVGLFLPAPYGNIADYKEETEVGNIGKFGEILGFRSILFVPLMRDARGIGVFALARKHIGHFSPHDVELVQTFADQAADRDRECSSVLIEVQAPHPRFAGVHCSSRPRPPTCSKSSILHPAGWSRRFRGHARKGYATVRSRVWNLLWLCDGEQFRSCCRTWRTCGICADHP